MKKKAKRPKTPIVHTCSDATASHRDQIHAVSRIHERASSTMGTVDNNYKMSLYGCMWVALSCLLVGGSGDFG